MLPAAASALHTDLYQLTMLQAYLAEDMHEDAVFELFVRRLPPNRRFLVAAGLGPALDWLQALHFGDDELAWLAQQPYLDRRLLDYLAGFRFRGDVDALPEGTVCFADEPLLRVHAPLPMAQLLETRLLNLMQWPTVAASKAARCVLAAGDARLVDFGLRRAHGAEAGLAAARAACLAGFTATSAVAAGAAYGLPLTGTMAHAYVLAHEHESDAFERFARARTGPLTLLLDTYDCTTAARRAVALAPRLRAAGIELTAVRLDSGDLDALSRQVRGVLDAGGLDAVRILVSGGLDEWRIAALRAAAAPIDGYGVGTAVATSEDAPALDCAYKLQAYAGRPCRKRSPGKATWPGARQVFRRCRGDGLLREDLVALADEHAAGEPLLVPVMRHGQRLHQAEPLGVLQHRCRHQLAALPPALRSLAPGDGRGPVRISPRLRALARRLDHDAH